MERLKQTTLEIEKLNETKKLKIKEITKKNINIPQDNPFGFLEYLERQRQENGVDLGLFLELAQKGKIVHNHAPVNTPLEDIEYLRNGFFMNGVFIKNSDGEVEADRFFRYSRVRADFIERTIDRYDVRPDIYNAGDKFRSFRNSRRVNQTNYGRGADAFIKVLEYEGENLHTLN